MSEYQTRMRVEAALRSYFASEGWPVEDGTAFMAEYDPATDESFEVSVDLTDLATHPIREDIVK